MPAFTKAMLDKLGLTPAAACSDVHAAIFSLPSSLQREVGGGWGPIVVVIVVIMVVGCGLGVDCCGGWMKYAGARDAERVFKHLATNRHSFSFLRGRPLAKY
jgi:hypothetical protein